MIDFHTQFNTSIRTRKAVFALYAEKQNRKTGTIGAEFVRVTDDNLEWAYNLMVETYRNDVKALTEAR